MLDKMSNWIDEIPPIDQPQRFGNKAFRDYFKRVKEVLTRHVPAGTSEFKLQMLHNLIFYRDPIHLHRTNICVCFDKTFWQQIWSWVQ